MNPCEVDGKVYDPRPWSQMICPNHALCTRDDEEIGLHCGPHPQYESCAYGADGCPACVSTANDPADLPAVAGKVRRDVGLVCEQCGGDCSQDTHWADNGDRRLCSACFSCEPNAGVSSSGDEPEYAPRPCSIQFRIGAKYNWKNQSERLVYLGQNFSGNGLWHQFALVENPGVVWCEVRDDSLQHFEESNSLLDRSHQSNSGA